MPFDKGHQSQTTVNMCHCDLLIKAIVPWLDLTEGNFVFFSIPSSQSLGANPIEEI